MEIRGLSFPTSDITRQLIAPVIFFVGGGVYHRKWIPISTSPRFQLEKGDEHPAPGLRNVIHADHLRTAIDKGLAAEAREPGSRGRCLFLIFPIFFFFLIFNFYLFFFIFVIFFFGGGRPALFFFPEVGGGGVLFLFQRVPLLGCSKGNQHEHRNHSSLPTLTHTHSVLLRGPQESPSF